VLPDDVKRFAHAALSHRIILEPSLWGNRSVENSVIDEVLQTVPVPVIKMENE